MSRFWSTLVVLLALVTAPGAGPWQATPEASSPASELRLAGRTVFTFRSPRAGYTPEQRCTAARLVLEQALRGPEPSVSQRSGPEGSEIYVGESKVFTVLPSDVDALAGEVLETLARDTVAHLSQALDEMRELRGVRGWLVALGNSALTLVVSAFLVLVLLRYNRRLSAQLGRLAERRSEKIRSTELRTIGKQSLVPLARGLTALLTWTLVGLVVFLALQRLLKHFPYSRPLGESLEAELLDEFRTLVLALAESIPGLVAVAFIWLCARFVLGIVHRYFQAAGRGLLHSDLAEAVTPQVGERLISTVVWLAALVVAFPYIPGSGSGAFQGVTVLAGLMVSLGSTSLVGQVASGLVLAYSRAFRVGDMVRFGEHEGTVVAFGLLATKIRTPRNEEVNVPNSVFTGSTTLNYSRYNREVGTFLFTQLTLGYDIPWRKVHELLLGAARRTEGLRSEPAPEVLQTALSDFYIEYELRVVAVDPAERPSALSRLHANVLDDFDAAGVAILSPHHTHLHGAVEARAHTARGKSGD